MTDPSVSRYIADLNFKIADLKSQKDRVFNLSINLADDVENFLAAIEKQDKDDPLHSSMAIGVKMAELKETVNELRFAVHIADMPPVTFPFPPIDERAGIQVPEGGRVCLYCDGTTIDKTVTEDEGSCCHCFGGGYQMSDERVLCLTPEASRETGNCAICRRSCQEFGQHGVEWPMMLRDALVCDDCAQHYCVCFCCEVGAFAP